MTRFESRTPSPPGPLSAVLVGAGFFLLAAAFARVGPFAPGASWSGVLDAARPGASESSAADTVPASVLVLGGSAAGLSVDGEEGEGDTDSLARDLDWLRAQGTGLIVLEAWLDKPPQSGARAFGEALRARLEALPSGRARRKALQALSATAAEFDAPERLTQALGRDRPILLVFQALPANGVPLPEELQGQSYQVSLRGGTQTLPEFRAQRLPFPSALAVSSGLAALPGAVDGNRVTLAVGMAGHWVNALGLEAARRALGLPLKALRFRWKRGVLDSLELADRRHALDGTGRLLFSGETDAGAPPGIPLSFLEQDSPRTNHLRGKTVFFRPWPLSQEDAQAFDAQESLFRVLMERSSASPTGPDPVALAAFFAAGLLGLSLLACAPVWVALPAWGGLVLLWIWAWSSGLFQGPAAMQSLACVVAVLFLGLGWRLSRRRKRMAVAERLLGGRVAPGRQVSWWRRLRTGSAAAQACYAVVGPRTLAQEADWDAWMERWGGFLDVDIERTQGGLGVALADPRAVETMVLALLDLRRNVEGLRVGLARGGLSFQAERSLGLIVWKIQGPCKDRALALFGFAQAGQILLAKDDFGEFEAFAEGRPLDKGATDPERGALVLLLGSKVDLWKRRP